MQRKNWFLVIASIASATGFITSLALILNIADVLTRRGLLADETKTAGWTTPTELALFSTSALGLFIFPAVLALIYRIRRKVSA
jgi:hypothetical protein